MGGLNSKTQEGWSRGRAQLTIRQWWISLAKSGRVGGGAMGGGGGKRRAEGAGGLNSMIQEGWSRGRARLTVRQC